MGLLLRTITKPKWVAPDWIAAGEVPADALSDLRSSDNKLSVWHVESDQGNLNMVLAAYAANRERLDKLDYTLLEEGIVMAMSIDCVKSEAHTPHLSANAAHRDLVELTVKKVMFLAQEMMPLPRVRVTEKQVKRLLLEALEHGALDRSQMKSELLSQLGRT